MVPNHPQLRNLSVLARTIRTDERASIETKMIHKKTRRCKQRRVDSPDKDKGSGEYQVNKRENSLPNFEGEPTRPNTDLQTVLEQRRPFTFITNNESKLRRYTARSTTRYDTLPARVDRKKNRRN